MNKETRDKNIMAARDDIIRLQRWIASFSEAAKKDEKVVRIMKNLSQTRDSIESLL